MPSTPAIHNFWKFLDASFTDVVANKTETVTKVKLQSSVAVGKLPDSESATATLARIGDGEGEAVWQQGRRKNVRTRANCC